MGMFICVPTPICSAPPLCINKDALEEGLEILSGCVDKVVDVLE